MASLQTFPFAQLVSNIATATQAACSSLLDFGVGSILRAVAQAVSGVCLWLQAIILQLLTVTRLSTSVGTDVDSFGADFGFTRLAATSSSGQVTFSRFSATQQAVIPIGATVQSSDGTQNFTVTLDTTNSAYDAGLGGYVIPINTVSVNVPVQANTGGTAANVQANTITVITTNIPGVDTVTNASAFTNGVNAESDSAYKVRFILFIASLSKATYQAIEAAVLGVQGVLDCTITENYAYNGTYQPGYFWVTVDDGTGYPSSPLLTNVGNAVEAVRGLTITYGVFAPVVLTANVTMVLTSASGYTHSDVIAAVAAALTGFINGLQLGVSLPYTQLASIAYDVPGVTNVTGILLNSGTSDLMATNKNKINCGILVIS